MLRDRAKSVEEHGQERRVAEGRIGARHAIGSIEAERVRADFRKEPGRREQRKRVTERNLCSGTREP